jgi:hypothetical protein
LQQYEGWFDSFQSNLRCSLSIKTNYLFGLKPRLLHF